MKRNILRILLGCACVCIAIESMQSQGLTEWTSRLSGQGAKLDFATAMTTDASGNVYVTGLQTNESPDYITVKLNPQGNVVWSAQYDGPTRGYDHPVAIALAPDGSVYVTGYSWGGDSLLWDYATVKYNATGSQLWVQRYNDGSENWATALVVDGSGNPVVVGRSRGAGSDFDIVTIAYASDGSILWSARYDSPFHLADEPAAAMMDGAGNLFITGRSMDIDYGFDFLTLKYARDSLLWDARYDGPDHKDDAVVSMALSGAGVVVAGRSFGSSNGEDIVTMMYTTGGALQWSVRYDGPDHRDDEPAAVAVDVNGNIILAARSASSTADEDIVTMKYDNTGVLQWSQRYATTATSADASPPLFSGLAAVYSNHPNSARLFWAPAMDDATKGRQITYHIYQSKTPGGFTFGQPSYTSTPGATDFLITDLSSDTTYYFVVRASDKGRNIDTNTVVCSVRPSQPSLLPGNPDDFVNDVIPFIRFPITEPDEYSYAGSIPISRRRVGVFFSDSVRVSQANALILSLGATIIGGEPLIDMLLLSIPDPGDFSHLPAVLGKLDANPLVAAYLPMMLGIPRQLPPHNPSQLARGWSWQIAPAGGNNGLELIRAPQSWNMKTYGVRHGSLANVGIIDGGFDATHPDLSPRIQVPTGTPIRDHGTHVAGIIGANWFNGLGVEGIAAHRPTLICRSSSQGSGVYSEKKWELDLQIIFRDILKDNPEVVAINMSYGLPDYYIDINGDGIRTPGTDRDIDPQNEVRPGAWFQSYAQLMDEMGKAFNSAAQRFERTRSNFLIAAAVGYDARVGVRTQDDSPMSNAAVTKPNGHFIAVEAIDANNRYNPAQMAFNVGGNVSAPGYNIRSTEVVGGSDWDRDGDLNYATVNGTSMATPHVTGLISYVWHLDPSLTYQQVWKLVTDPKFTVPPTGPLQTIQPRIDAFNAIMGIDVVRNDPNKTMQRALVDVDDGTLDGNMRTQKDPRNAIISQFGTVNTNKIFDNLRGDAVINMADFRAFRDALIQANFGGANLDGDPDNPKKDLNLDGCVNGLPYPGGAANCLNSPNENVFPRFDFNGDGTVGFSKVGSGTNWPAFKDFLNGTDAQVLYDVWPDDPDQTEGWQKTDLDGLLPDVSGNGGSGDLELRAHDLFQIAEVKDGTVEVFHSGLPNPSKPRAINKDSGTPAPFDDMVPYLVSTVKTTENPIRMTGTIRDASGKILSDLYSKFINDTQPWSRLQLGEDRVIGVEPCVFKPDVWPTASGSGTVLFQANAKDRDIVPNPLNGIETGITSYGWKFGDGNTSGDINPSHKYDKKGVYHVSLTVTDNDPVEWGNPKTSIGTLTYVEEIYGVAVGLNMPDSTGKAPALSGCVNYDSNGNPLPPPFDYTVVVTIDTLRYKPSGLYFIFKGVTYTNLTPPEYQAEGYGLTSKKFVISKGDNITFFVSVLDSLKSKLLGYGAITLDVEKCGQVYYDYPSYRVIPNRLRGGVKKDSGFTVIFRPTIEVNGQRTPPATTKIEWDLNFADDAAAGGNGDGKLDMKDFNIDATTNMQDSLMKKYDTPGRFAVMTKCHTTSPVYYVAGGTTVIADIDSIGAQIVDVKVTSSGTTLEPKYTIQFTGEGFDPNNRTLTYTWIVKDDKGIVVSPAPPSAKTSSVIVDKIDSYSIELTVSNDRGQSGLAHAAKSVMKTQIP